MPPKSEPIPSEELNAPDEPTASTAVTDPVLWWLTGALAVLVSVGTYRMGWEVDPIPLRLFLLQFGSLVTVAVFYHASGRSFSLARMAYASALFLLMANMCQASTYLLGTHGRPFQDGTLRAADAALGFSWAHWTAWLDRSPELRRVFGVVYRADLTEAALLVILLSLRSLVEVSTFLRAVALAFVVALIGQQQLPALGLIPEAASIPIRLGLRDGSYHTLAIIGTPGIISMPSFHAVMAVLVVMACWRYRTLRWPMAAFNLVMLVATVSEGGHYLVDVIAGALLGVAAYLLSQRSTRWPAVADVE